MELKGDLDPMEEHVHEQALWKRYRDRNRKYLEQFRRRTTRKLREPEPKGSSSFDFEPSPVDLYYEIDPVDEANYLKQVEESRGFEIDSFSCPYGGIMPVDVGYTETLMGKVGLHCYNVEKKKKLVFNGVTKTTVQGCSFHLFYITLEAHDPENNNAVVTIQTRVCMASPEGNEDLRFIVKSCSIKGSGEHEKESHWDSNRVDKFYRGKMPDWVEVSDDCGRMVDNGFRVALDVSEPFTDYVFRKSDLKGHNEWLYHYMEVVAFAKLDTTMVHKRPLDLMKVVVQIGKEYDMMEEGEWWNMSTLWVNAIFFITFMACGGLYRGIIRQASDGRPQHMCVDVVCEQVL